MPSISNVHTETCLSFLNYLLQHTDVNKPENRLILLPWHSCYQKRLTAAAHSESFAACPAKSILLGTSTSVKLASHFVHRHAAILTHGQDSTQSKGQRKSIQYVFRRHKPDSRMCLAALEVPCLYERNYIAKLGRFGLCHSLTRQPWCQINVW